MKETYVKPELRFESFTLSHSIAGGCNANAISVVNALIDLDSSLFASNSSYTCTVDFDNSSWASIYEGYCYWNGTMKLMTS